MIILGTDQPASRPWDPSVHRICQVCVGGSEAEGVYPVNEHLRQPPVVAYVGLGSNLADPEARVRQAMDDLDGLPETALIARSALYRTVPVGPVDQPDFVNAVVRLETRLSPRALLRSLQALELAHGRHRDGTRWGPRTLDLDILLYGAEQVREPGLRIPHPEIARRAFVLVPLADVASSGLSIPASGPLSHLLEACGRDGITRISGSWSPGRGERPGHPAGPDG
jgi:2-amino-4-hydroxy-6-hydroxymethyldihydropteridine diphosphokinase